MASTLRWRKQLHRVYIEAFAHRQFFRCKLNQNKRSRHSLFFFFEAMQGYDDNNQKSEKVLQCYCLHSQLRRENFRASPNYPNTFTRTSIHTNMKGSAHHSFPLLHDWSTSELFNKNEKSQSFVYILRSGYPTNVQKSN